MMSDSTVRWYSVRRLIESRIIESAAYCNQTWLGPIYKSNTQKIRRLIESSCYCYHFYVGRSDPIR
jgi:hypothetical protein